MSAVRGVWQPV